MPCRAGWTEPSVSLQPTPVLLPAVVHPLPLSRHPLCGLLPAGIPQAFFQSSLVVQPVALCPPTISFVTLKIVENGLTC